MESTSCTKWPSGWRNACGSERLARSYDIAWAWRGGNTSSNLQRRRSIPQRLIRCDMTSFILPGHLLQVAWVLLASADHRCSGQQKDEDEEHNDCHGYQIVVVSPGEVDDGYRDQGGHKDGLDYVRQNLGDRRQRKRLLATV